MNDGETYDGSHLVAISMQLLEGLHLPRIQIGSDSVDHFMKKAMRYTVALDGIAKRRPQQVLAELALQRAIEFNPPVRDPFPNPGFSLFARLVAQVVAMPV